MASRGNRRNTPGVAAKNFFRRATLCAAFAGAVAGPAAANDIRGSAPLPAPDAQVRLLPAPASASSEAPFHHAARAPLFRDAPSVNPPDTVAPPPFTPQPIVASTVIEDTMTPEACAPNTDPALVTKNLPEISRALAMMAQLPLTGTGVYAMLQDPANHMGSCLEPAPLGQASESEFEGTKAKISRGGGTESAFHEYFHAWQSVREGNDDMFSLTMKDALVANLLTEATAVAYEMSANREAQNHHLAFEPSSVRVEKVPHGTITHSTLFASTMPENIKAYNTAYDAAWKQGAALDAQNREAAALQAGGQAVVRRLMGGQDKSWQASYTKIALGNVNNNLDSFTADAASPDYAAKRLRVFSSQGTVSDRISFVPAEYLSPDADTAIDKCFKTMGFSIEKLPPPPAPPASPPPLTP